MSKKPVVWLFFYNLKQLEPILVIFGAQNPDSPRF